MHEVLACRRNDLAMEFARGFERMTVEPISREELVAAKETLIESIVGRMPTPHRKFLISFEEGNPDWEALDIRGAAALPAVQWRQKKSRIIERARRDELVAELKRLGWRVISPA